MRLLGEGKTTLHILATYRGKLDIHFSTAHRVCTVQWYCCSVLIVKSVHALLVLRTVSSHSFVYKYVL